MSSPSIRPINAANVRGSLDSAGGTRILSTVDDSSAGGLGPALRRFIASGFYNGDFSEAPSSAEGVIGTSNPLPFWAVGGTGATISVALVADSGAASGYKAVFEALAGSIGDERYLEQLVAINGSRGQSFALVPILASLLPSNVTTTELRTFIRAQPIKSDGVTVTGSETTSTLLWNAYGAVTVYDLIAITQATPADAYFLRIRIGVERVTTGSDTGTVAFSETRMAPGAAPIYLPDQSTPASYAHATFFKSAGILQVQVPKGATPGTIISFTMDGPGGLITLSPSASSPDGYLDINGRLVGRPDTTQLLLSAGATIGVDKYVQPISSDANYTLTSVPTIADGLANGQLVIVVNVGSFTVTLQDQGTLAGSNLRLSAATVALGPRDSITLLYSSTIGDWIQIAQTNVL